MGYEMYKVEDAIMQTRRAEKSLDWDTCLVKKLEPENIRHVECTECVNSKTLSLAH